jgi:NitT/TauT family transport system permease protein
MTDTPAAAAHDADTDGRRRLRVRVKIPWLAIVAPLVFFATFIGLWEILVKVRDIQILLLPAPSDIWSQFVEDFPLLRDLAKNTAIESIKGVVIGAVLAIGLAGLVHGIGWLNKSLLMYSSTIKALPIVALYPICTVFFGVTSSAIVAMVSIAVAPIMYTFASRGFSGTSEQDELMRSISAGWFTRFRSLVLPRALPYVMAGLKTAVPLSIIVAIISEYFGGSVTTLGSYIRRESVQLHTPEMWSAIVMACILGLVAFAAVSLLDRYFLRWHPSRRGN